MGTMLRNILKQHEDDGLMKKSLLTINNNIRRRTTIEHKSNGRGKESFSQLAFR